VDVERPRPKRGPTHGNHHHPRRATSCHLTAHLPSHSHARVNGLPDLPTPQKKRSRTDQTLGPRGCAAQRGAARGLEPRQASGSDRTRGTRVKVLAGESCSRVSQEVGAGEGVEDEGRSRGAEEDGRDGVAYAYEFVCLLSVSVYVCVFNRI
jgi:hypothetical protein